MEPINVIVRADPSEPLPDGYVDVADAARYLGTSRPRVRRRINNGTLEHVVETAPGRTGFRYLIPTAALEAWRTEETAGQKG